jgi:hypothetical protein
MRWGAVTFEHLLRLHRSAQAKAAGVQYITAHCLYSANHGMPSDPPWRDIVHNWRTLTPEALKRMGYANMVGARAFESLVADPTYYMPWLLQSIQASGHVTMVQRRLRSLRDLADIAKFDVVFNCTGAPQARSMPHSSGSMFTSVVRHCKCVAMLPGPS